MRVKICGIKRCEDALLAAELGADAIGLLVGQRHPSRDFISPAEARDIAQMMPPFVSPVLVTHLESIEELRRLIDTVAVATVQIHSDISPDAVSEVRKPFPFLKVLKSCHVTSEKSLTYGESFQDIVDGFVLDTVNLNTGQVGGTGKVHDWNISREIVTRYKGMPFLLAGGLTPENVASAIQAVSPYGVDVNSGTKGEHGFKDPTKLRKFISQAKAAALTNSAGRNR